MNKKIISIILAITFIFSTFSFSVSAIEQTADEANGIYTYTLDSYEVLTSKKLSGVIAQSKEISANSSTFLLYNSLTSNQKIIYNAIVEAKAGLNCSPKGKITVNLPANDDFDVYDIYYATAAIVDDKPEFYWLLSAPYNVTFDSNTSVLTLNVDISQLVYKTWTDLEREYNNLLNTVEKFVVRGNNRYEMVKNIYTKIGNMAHYSENLTNSTSPENSKVFFPSSALLYPYETVCDGYSKAIKMVCDKYEIPCIVVAGYGYSPILFGLLLSGGGHAWNYVQMEDGKWYALDLTWDDADTGVGYDFFLIGSDTKDSSTNLPFKTSHVAAGDRFYGVSFDYPALSKTAYVYNPQALPQEPSSNLGDVTGDGKVTVIDAKWILQSVANLRALTNEQSTIGDVNKDGRITVVDAKWILQAVAGSRVIK